MPAMDTDNLLTVQDASTRYNLAETTLRCAMLDGRLPFVHQLGRKLIPIAEMEGYIQRTRPDGVKRVGRPRKQKPSP